jgi:hypothetical protein
MSKSSIKDYSYDDYRSIVVANMIDSDLKDRSLSYGEVKDFDHFIVNTKTITPVAIKLDGGSITLDDKICTYTLEIVNEVVNNFHNTDIKSWGKFDLCSVKRFFKYHKTVFNQQRLRIAIRNWIIGIDQYQHQYKNVI